jgi:RHS repeat-associated protein
MRRLCARCWIAALFVALTPDVARAQPVADKTGTAPSVLSLPSGPGSIEGLGKSFQPLLNTGGASFAIPIELPQGPAGWAPAVSMSYHSGQGNSALGQGWRLEAGLSIERQTSKGFPNYRDSDASSVRRDVFVFKGEELVPLIDGTYRLRSDDQHRRFQPIAPTSGAPVTSWLIEDRNGGRHWLGRYHDETGVGRSSRIVHPFPEAVGLAGRTSFERTFQWLEDAAEDVHGNRIEFDYATTPASPGVLYLQTIRYLPHAVGNAYHVVGFFTEPRPDQMRDQQAGFPRRIARRYREIAVGSFFDGGLHPLRSYVLSYAAKDGPLGELLEQTTAATRPVDTGSSRLHMVTRFGSDRAWGGTGAAGTPLPPTRLGYSALFFGAVPEPLAARLVQLRLQLGTHEDDPLLTGPAYGTLGQQAAGGGVLKTFDTPLELPQVQFADVNGDGLPDLLDSRVSALKPHYTVALNLGAGIFGQSQSLAHPDGIDLGQSTPANEALLADRYGKGTVDLVYVSGSGGDRTTRVFASRAAPFAPHGALGFALKPTTEVATALEINLLAPDARLGDLNFDKSPDVLITDASGIRGYGAAPNGGWLPLGFSPWAQTSDGITDAYRFSNLRDGHRVPSPLVQLIDIDGDRLPDLVQVIVRQSGVAEVRYRPLIGPMLWGTEIVFEFALPDGSASGIVAELQLPGLMPTPSRDWEAVRLLDVNGDGLPDVVYLTPDQSLILYMNCHGGALAGPFVVSDMPRYAPEDPTNPTVLRVLDVNGNGSTDLVFYQPASSDQFQFVDFLAGQKPGLLQIVDNGIGLRTFIRYKPTVADLIRADRGRHPWNSVSPLATWAVAAVIEDIGLDLNGDGRSDRYVKTINYRDPYYDGLEKQFRGFAFVETIEWGDDVEAAGLPTQAPAAGIHVSTVTRYRYFTGAPDGIDNDVYVDGFDVEPRPVAVTVDEASERGGREEDALKGKQVLVEIAHGAVLGDASGEFNACAEVAAQAAARLGQYADAALRCAPDKYVYERRVDRWQVRRLYRPVGAVAPKGRLSRYTPETVAVPDVSVSLAVMNASTTERIEANGLMQTTFAHPNAPFPAAAPRKIAVEFDYDDFGNQILLRELGAISATGAAGDEARTERTTFVLPVSKSGRIEPWILNRPASRRLESKDGVFIREERFFYDGADFIGLPAGKLGAQGIVKRRQARVLDRAAVPPEVLHAPQAPDDVEWLSWPGDPRSGVTEWIDTERAAYDAFGNRIVTMDALGALGTDGAPTIDVGHFVRTTFDPVFHTFPIREEKVVGLGHSPIVFETFYTSGATPALDRWGFGTPRYSVDPNGHRTNYGYDVHGRLTAIMRPGDSEAVPTLVYHYRAGDPHRGLVYDYDRAGILYVAPTAPATAANALRTETRQAAGSADVRASIAFSSGRAQRLLVLEEDEGGTFSATAAARFGARGTAVFEAQPYRQPDDAFQPVPVGTAGTELAIDGLGRTILRRAPPESSDAGARRVETRIHFLPLAERHFDAEDLSSSPGAEDHTGTPTTREFDGFNRLTAVTETVRTATGMENWITRYGWNGADERTWIRDSQDNLRWSRFDGLGRAIAHFDVNRGPVTYWYDATGNLTQTDDAKGQRLLFGYDGLNRLVSEEYTSPGAVAKTRPDVAYRYDAPDSPLVVDGAAVPLVNTKGFLVSIRDLSGEEHKSYDERGRPNLLVKRVANPDGAGMRTFVIRQTYDPSDRVRLLIYPDGSSLDFSYDKRGKTKGIVGSFGRIVDERTYDAAGFRERTTFANGVVTEQSYDPRFRPASIVTRDATAHILLEYGYQFDGASNLLAIADQRVLAEVGSQDPRRNDQTFSYDDAYRLVRAAYPQTELTFAYDRLGSMTRHVVGPSIGVTAPAAVREQQYELAHSWRRVGRDGDAPGAHAMQAVDGAPSLAYDANGNLERLGDVKLSWDPKDRLVGVQTQQARVDYSYDYAGRRVTRLVRPAAPGAQAQTTLYPDRAYEAVGGETFRYVFDGETRVARLDSSDHALFYHPDHLGSAALITDGQGKVVEENAFYPFGELRNRSGVGVASPHYLFGQKEYDPLAGLHNFEARQLVAGVARFAAVDPVLSRIPREGLLNPQMLNGYAYAANNPLKFRDSSGRWVETAFDLVSLGLSIDAVRHDASLLNVGAVVVDAVAVALPLVPAGAGLALRGGRAVHTALEAAPKAVEAIPASRAFGAQASKGLEVASGMAGTAAASVEEGTKVFRVFGGEARGLGQSWTTVDPGTVTNFREAAGLYPTNTGQFVVQGKLMSTEGVLLKRADPGPGGIGGGISEVVVPNAAGQVCILCVSGVNPPL